MSSIMDRVEQTKQRESIKKEEARTEMMNQEMQNWLDSLNHRNRGDKRSPAVGCLNYVWKLQHHNRPIVRRMSLHLCGHLLLQNDECRDRWQDGLLDWISSVVDVKQVADKYAKEIILWQKEAMLWVSYMTGRFPGDNKLRVAAMFLEQKGPSLHTEDMDVNKNMTDWRRIRDIAMMYGDRQCEIVEKLARRSYVCIDILMPRIGIDAGEQDQRQDDDGDDDDAIDWEEGDEEVAAETHAAAVEQTLALMETTGGLRGGDMEIRLNHDDSGGDHSNSDERTRQRLHKVVTSLSTRHLPCLSTWVNSMTEADNLLLHNGSLVAMSQEDSQKRHAISQRLMSVKRIVASVLSAASRLEIKAEEKQDTGGIPRNTFLTNVPQRHLALSQTMERRRQGPSSEVTRKRSNRIQVKFNKKT